MFILIYELTILKKMEEFIDNLCKRRLCLPSNVDINLIRSGQTKSYKTCECLGASQHIACALGSNASCFKSAFIWNKYV